MTSHRAVVNCDLGPRPPKPEHEGCHRDNNRTNNRLGNLRWDTPAGNAADKKRRGLDVDPLSELRAELTAIAAGIDPETIPF